MGVKWALPGSGNVTMRDITQCHDENQVGPAQCCTPLGPNLQIRFRSAQFVDQLSWGPVGPGASAALVCPGLPRYDGTPDILGTGGSSVPMEIYDTPTFNSSVHAWLIFLHFHCLQALPQHKSMPFVDHFDRK